MADGAQVKILKSGVAAWNAWRKTNPKIRPDLSGSDVRRMDLIGANLRRADLHGANLRKSDLSETDLSFANLRQANLSDARLVRAQLYKVSLSQATLIGVDLSQAGLVKARLDEARLDNANLTQADMTRVDLSYSSLSKARALAVDLSGALLVRTILTHTDLSGATLSDAALIWSDLSDAKLCGAKLINTQILELTLDSVDLTAADLTHAILGRTRLLNLDLRSVEGLATITHRSPSSIGVDTLLRSQGNIPEEFLRGVGLPDDFILYLRSLTASPIEFYSCFISYSSKDREFAERLHADLQAKNVRCWFAPEDLKIGDKFRTRIEESIRVYDKLMVVLSESSIQSPWVEEEVEAALEKERQQNKPVLFPIRLDDAVMETKQAWAASLRRTRHIGEFSNWKDHDRYKKAFDRLLRDLKAESTKAATAED